MTRIVDELQALAEHVDAVLTPLIRGGDIRGVDDAELIAALRSAAQIQRRVDAVMVDAVGEVDARCAMADRDARLSTRLGCHDVPELIERATRLSRTSASRYRKAAAGVTQDASVTTGELLEPKLPALRAAMIDGVVGVDGMLAIAGPLSAMDRRVSHEDVLTVDAILAAHARGEAPDGAPPASADLLRVHAQTWAAFLDQDGAEPRDNRATHHRGLTLGPETDRGFPIRGNLLPDVAAQLLRTSDAVNAPKVAVRFSDPDADVNGVEGDLAPVDTRTRAQKLHDAFAIALSVAASSENLPTVGGAAPTLVVTIREEDLLSAADGYVHEHDAPISPAATRRVGCAGVIQRVVLDRQGAIRSLGTEERVFNRHQRRAIAARDGGCLIPGCGVPAGWCEIHHVVDHALGGPTHTSNGVLLCWYHHRYLDKSGWLIRIINGVPEVRAPAWADATLRWRPVTKSKTRMLAAVRRQ